MADDRTPADLAEALLETDSLGWDLSPADAALLRAAANALFEVEALRAELFRTTTERDAMYDVTGRATEERDQARAALGAIVGERNDWARQIADLRDERDAAVQAKNEAETEAAQERNGVVRLDVELAAVRAELAEERLRSAALRAHSQDLADEIDAPHVLPSEGVEWGVSWDPDPNETPGRIYPASEADVRRWVSEHYGASAHRRTPAVPAGTWAPAYPGGSSWQQG